MAEAAYRPLSHPQRQDGEVFMGWCWDRWDQRAPQAVGTGWLTRRVGEHDGSGRADARPWFVAEYELAGEGVWDAGRKAFLGEWDDAGCYVPVGREPKGRL